MRAAIYGRVSTDLQSKDSTQDQEARCREYAARSAWSVVVVDADEGMSGASSSRPGLARIMDAIDEWDVLLVWDGSRLARNESLFFSILDRVEAAEKRIVEVSTGSDLLGLGGRIGGILNAEERRKIGANTHRGCSQQFERGLAPGAVPYGYRNERNDSPDGRRNSRTVVVEDQAVVVRRIFDEYLSGSGYKAIAHSLNKDGVPSPRGKGWAVSGIRSTLRNPLYRGERIYNRTRWIGPKGARIRRDRPETEWQRGSGALT